jgi:DNA (cytosine-5)-methyltransferase 1
VRYVSLFSGIEGASVAWEGLGWEPMAFSEIEPFPCAVLAARFPEVPNLGDITEVDWFEFKRERGVPDIVVGGSPCQSFSVAGKREGLKGASGLMYEYIRAVRELRPRWFLWENVPGALSVERGAAFGQLLSEMADCGYGLAWRVLDAQFCRVPVYSDSGELERFVGPVAQRRRRVFLVGCLAGEGAVEVLLEPEGMRGDIPSSREKRKALAADARSRAEGADGRRGAVAFAQNTRDEVRVQGDGTISGALAAQPGMKQQTYLAECLTPWDVQSKRVHGENGVSPTLSSGTGEGMNIQPVVMASAHYNAEIGEGGCHADPDGPRREAGASTSNGEDVFPSLLATDGDKQFIDNQSVDGGRLVLQPTDSDGGRQREDGGGRGHVRVPEGRGGVAHDCVASNGESVVGALCARDYKGVGSQYVDEGKVIACRLRTGSAPASP